MKARVSKVLILGITLTLTINLVGGLLLHRTYEQSSHFERDLLLQGEQLARGILMTLSTIPTRDRDKMLPHLAEQLLGIESIESTLFVGRNDQVLAQSGIRIPSTMANDVKRKETYGERQGSRYYISLPVTASEYVSGLTQTTQPQGYIILALNTSTTNQQTKLLNSYFISGAILLLCLNGLLLAAAVGYGRRLNAYRNAPPEIRQQFDRGYRQLEQFIDMQKAEVEKARNEALKTSEIKSQFIANMSHEIRTPLNSILGFTNLLLKSKLDHRQKDFLLTIRKSSMGLLQIINDILDFSKIEAGKVSLDKISIDLRETVEDVLTVLAPSAHEKRLELISIFAPDLANHLLADPLRLKQILTNLISNSIKFTNNGSIAVRVSIEEREGENATFKISVSDTGIGIPREKQAKLFQTFSQVDTSTTREYGGSGLGLVIAKELVQQMKGSIGVNSHPNRGANFWFTFQAQVTQSNQPLPLFEPLAGNHIAIFDEHPLVRMSLTQLLEEWKATTSATGRLEQIEQFFHPEHPANRPDVVILNINLETTDAKSYDAILKRLTEEYHCPALLMHYTDGEQYDRSLLPDNQVLTLAKPLRYQELLLALSKLLDVNPNLPADLTLNKEANALSFETPPKVLAVDDNHANLKLVSILLGDMGAEVTKAESGPEALRYLAKNTFDIIYMDIQMPGMDGVEVTRRIRSIPSSNQDIPIIALTAHALPSEKNELLQNGMDDYLSKPVTERQLVETILRWTDITLKPLTKTARLQQNSIKPEVQPFEPATLERNKDLVENSNEVVDIKSAIEKSAGKEDLAQELFEMLLNSLGEESETIRQAYKAQNYETLHQLVHRLHGGARYCGVPALTAAFAHTETILKQEKAEELDQSIQQLLGEMQRVLQWAESNEWATPQN